MQKPRCWRDFMENTYINQGLKDFMAERVGFEPTVPLTVRLISSQVHSTTLPPLRTVKGL